jgi:CubicO group peptidase (beta-lactamase class C family)
MSAFCVLVLVDRGVIDLDERIAQYWPEFGEAGKQDVTVRQALSHQAGFVALREPQPLEILFDWDRACAVLAAEPPWFEPGSAHAVQTLFYGHFCGQLVRRADGRSLGQFWREEVAAPWRLDFCIETTDRERARIVDLRGEIPPREGEPYRLATSNPPGLLDVQVVNSEAWRAAEIPAVNGHGTAEAVARFYAGMVNGGQLGGVRIVSREVVDAMTRGELTAVDLVLDEQATWGLGVRVWEGAAYGMAGIGGSLGLADRGFGLAESYVTRQAGTLERAETMDAAVRSALP